MEPAVDSGKSLAALVTEAAKLHARLAAIDTDRLDQIKAILRDRANGHKTVFTGENGETCTVLEPGEGILRTVPDPNRARVVKLAGKHAKKLFNLNPVKNFELEVLRRLPRKAARNLLSLVKTMVTARVTFG